MENSSETAIRFSEALKRVMFEYRISGKQLAEWSNINPVQISDFRSAKRVPNLENFLKLLESLPEDARQYYIELLLDKKNTSKV